MAPGDWKETVGKQRAVWAQPGGKVFVKTAPAITFDAVVIEAGTAVREDYFTPDDDLHTSKVSIPIMVVPSDAVVVKTVAMAALASIHYDSESNGAVWAVDQVDVEEDIGTRQLSLIAHTGEAGSDTNLLRIAYHITIFVQGQQYTVDPDTLQELDTA